MPFLPMSISLYPRRGLLSSLSGVPMPAIPTSEVSHVAFAIIKIVLILVPLAGELISIVGLLVLTGPR